MLVTVCVLVDTLPGGHGALVTWQDSVTALQPFVTVIVEAAVQEDEPLQPRVSVMVVVEVAGGMVGQVVDVDSMAGHVDETVTVCVTVGTSRQVLEAADVLLVVVLELDDVVLVAMLEL